MGAALHGRDVQRTKRDATAERFMMTSQDKSNRERNIKNKSSHNENR